MREEIAGLHIGRRYVTAAQLTCDWRGNWRVRHLGWDERDKQDHKPEKLVATVQNAMRHAGIHSCTVAAALQPGHCLIKAFSYPYMAENELSEALHLEAEESLIQENDNICLDWHINRLQKPENVSATGGVTEGYLVAAPRQHVETDLGILRRARLYPVMLGTEILALCDLFMKTAASIKSMENTCLICMTDKEAHICIFSEDNAAYPRTVAFGQDVSQRLPEVVEDINEFLSYEKYKLHVPEVQNFVILDERQEAGQLTTMLREELDVTVETWCPWDDIQIKRDLLDAVNEGPGMMVLPALGLAVQGE